MTNTAINGEHRSLYHWQPFTEGEESEIRLVNLLNNKSIYCSNPRDFNDPWDCTPCFNSEILKDVHERTRFAIWLLKAVRKSTGNRLDPLDVIKIEQFIFDPECAEKFIRQYSDYFASTLYSQYRVYCLGSDVSNVLMWSHYADSHRGICLEFSVANEVFCKALPCIYRDKYPIIKLHDNSDLKLILVKSSVWGYEKEYRIIAQEACYGADDQHMLRTNNGHLQIPDGSLTSVIVGCRGNIGRVEGLVKKHAPQVKTKFAQQAANRYAIRIQEM